MASEDLVRCPWCAEEIRPDAKKCKHCGEYLTDESPSPTSPGETSEESAHNPVWSFGGVAWRCIEHDRVGCLSCRGKVPIPKTGGKKGDVFPSAPGAYSGRMGSRERLSDVGAKGEGGLACPKCGSTQFVAKRSNKGKVVGFATLGVGGLLAPKSQVKCVACGTMFKRG